MIAFNKFGFKYIGRKAQALREIDIHIASGETVLLLGPSGSGKSTLALALNGLIPHNIGGKMEGEVCIAGLVSNQASVADLSQEVGIIFQDPEAQFVTMNVEDEIAFGLENLQVPPEEMDVRIEEALEEVGIAHYRRRKVDALSGGEKQRLALAAVLAMRPQCIVFDEPTANLDPLGTRQVFETIGRLKALDKYTIIIIEHKLDDLMEIVDRVIALTGEGKVFVEGSPETIFETHIQKLYDEGVWVPQIVQLSHQLRQMGVPMHTIPVTLNQAKKMFQTISIQIPQNGHKPEERKPDKLETAVEVRNLSFEYEHLPVLSNINLKVFQGDFLVIIGANGAGKTTLAKHMIDTIHPPAQTVFINGKDIIQYNSKDLIRKVGYVFQNPEHQFITNSVAHEIAFGLRQLGISEHEIEEKVQDFLTQFNLQKLAKANPFTLSHGEKRRLSVATMLAVGQDTLILDEPTFGQDQRNADALMKLLKHLHLEGRTIIIITHDMTLVAEYAQHCAVMAGGELLFYGESGYVFNNPQLLEKANLTMPPIAELSSHMQKYKKNWNGIATIADFKAVFQKPVS
jgi:energy-coupling factor transport system ATP-binding protein